MWYITKERFERFTYSQCLILPQSDEEWSDILTMFHNGSFNAEEHFHLELKECKEKLLSVLPNRFKTYVHNGTLNQPSLAKEIRDDYQQWQLEECAAFQNIINESKQHFKTIQHQLPEKLVRIFKENLFGAKIMDISRQDNHLNMLLDTEKCEIPQAQVSLSFKDIIQVDGDAHSKQNFHLLYHEIYVNSSATALRMVTCENGLWTIEAKAIDVEVLF